MSVRQRDIVIGRLLRTAATRSWAARDDLLRLAVIPLALLLLIMVPFARTVEAMSEAGAATAVNPDTGLLLRGMLLGMAYAAVIAVFSVNWLRQLTLGYKGVPGLGLTLAARHLRFFLVFVGIAFVAMLPVMFLYPVFAIVLQGQAALLAGAALAFLVWASVVARLSPGWIGIAIDAPLPLRVAWRRTAGQGFKLVVAMLAVQVVMMLVQQIVEFVFALSGLGAVAPMTYLLAIASVDLAGISVQLAVLVAALPHFLGETV